MKKYLLSLAMLFSAGAVTLPASAVPIVAADSSYTFFLGGSTTGEIVFGATSFDGLAEGISANSGQQLIVTESESLLPSGQSRIVFDLRGDASLFTDPSESIFFGIGIGGDGFDLLRAVSLDSVILTLFDVNGPFDVTPGLEGEVSQPNPWSGYFPNPVTTIGLGGVDASGIVGLQVEFLVTQLPAAVPEPGSILLCGIGLVGVVAMRRRRV